jgi:Uncharacterized ACR, COG1430/PilZ domain
MELRQQCAFNKTRGCLLTLNVSAGDYPLTILADWMAKLTRDAGAALWLVPFRGVPSEGVRVPLDLIYLDEMHRVTAVVENFPIFCLPPSARVATSVLVLPAGLASSTHTQPGDELIVATPEEIRWQLERSSPANPVVGDEPSATKPRALANEEPPEASLPRALQSEPPSAERRPNPPQAQERVPLKPEPKPTGPKGNWLKRWFSDPSERDKRKVRREPTPSLIAYFWTGGAPEVHAVRDVSSSGLYVVTEERWYPGTLIRITLTKTSGEDLHVETSITVQARAVRWGNDGVGLEFVLNDSRNPSPEQTWSVDGADRKQLERFLDQCRGR